MAKQASSGGGQIIIQRPNLANLVITVCSTDGSTYIPHRISDETVDNITGKQTGKATQKKLRNFDEEYESCFYYTPDNKYGAPAAAFLRSMLDASIVCGVPKTQIKRAIRIIGDVYELRYKEVRRRIDNCVIGPHRSPDKRHRPEFIDWECDIYIQFDENQISADQICNLLDTAGFTSGIGDWRPSAPKGPGSNGMFHVKQKDINVNRQK